MKLAPQCSDLSEAVDTAANPDVISYWMSAMSNRYDTIAVTRYNLIGQCSIRFIDLADLELLTYCKP